jgi:hypothetical protein
MFANSKFQKLKRRGDSQDKTVSEDSPGSKSWKLEESVIMSEPELTVLLKGLQATMDKLLHTGQ